MKCTIFEISASEVNAAAVSFDFPRFVPLRGLACNFPSAAIAALTFQLLSSGFSLSLADR